MRSLQNTDRDLQHLCDAAIAAQSAERDDAVDEMALAAPGSATVAEPTLRTGARLSVESAEMQPAAMRSSGERCISITRLSQVAARNLAMDANVRQHLQACAKCRARFAALRGSANLGYLPALLRRRSIWTALAAAAACGAALFALPRGSTSPRGPIAATVASYCNLGDVNCDGKVTETDMDAFQLALFDPDLFAIRFPTCDGLCGADANCDGRIDDQDVEPFLFMFDGG